ncbi:hypothetical protein BH10PSE1_BH10PSE1_18280 [soil metagenome]
MSAFEFFFSFYGLILGLSVAEVITGLVRVFKTRERVRIGWLTPLLGLFVLLDVASFWNSAWGSMQGVEVGYGLLVMGLFISGVYFAAASLVTPDDPDQWPDFDAYYDRHKRYVLAGVFIANLLANVVVDILLQGGAAWLANHREPMVWLAIGLYNLTLLLLVLIRDRRVNIALLSFVIALYGVSAIVF